MSQRGLHLHDSLSSGRPDASASGSPARTFSATSTVGIIQPISLQCRCAPRLLNQGQGGIYMGGRLNDRVDSTGVDVGFGLEDGSTPGPARLRGRSLESVRRERGWWGVAFAGGLLVSGAMVSLRRL